MWYNLSMKVSDYKYIIVGAGFFGATVAERLASRGEKVLVIDRRKHVAGNAYSYRDENTGIEIHQYGSHIFHTDNEEVWNYITRFTEFNILCSYNRSLQQTVFRCTDKIARYFTPLHLCDNKPVEKVSPNYIDLVAEAFQEIYHHVLRHYPVIMIFYTIIYK